MNFEVEFLKGQEGKNQGIPMGEGLTSLSNAINGIQHGKQFVVASAPKVGKSTFVNYGFVIQPYLYCLQHNIEIEWIYYSLEMKRVQQEFDFASFFFFYDHKIKEVELPMGIRKDNKTTIPISSAYLRGIVKDDEGNMIKVSKEHSDILFKIYNDRIIPLFGRWNPKTGVQETRGKIIFIKDSSNPTGINKDLLAYAEQNGKIIKKNENGYVRNVSYVPNNPEKYVIVVTDHLRKLIPEQGMKTKGVVDKMSEYHCILRDLLNFTFVDIIHLNRSVSDITRMKAFSDMLFPSSDDVKDTGNLAEDCDYLITLFNPNDERYNLTKHFKTVIKTDTGSILYPGMRSVHLVESRHCEFPQHFRVEMEGGIKNFNKLII